MGHNTERTNTMKTGTELTALAQRVMEQAKSKRDFAMDTRKLTVTERGNLQFIHKGQILSVTPTERCLNQIAARVGIPRIYADRLMTEAPELLAKNVNHWFQTRPEVRMVRTYMTEAPVGRAFLSHRYRALDNEDLLNAVLPQLTKAGCEIKSAEATERRIYVQAVTPKVQGEVKVGDVVQAGVVISNSEVGAGSLKVEPLHYRLACQNGMILPSALKKHHVGRSGDGEWEAGEANEVFSDDTRRLDDKAFWAKVNDVVTASVSEIHFNKTLEVMRNAAKQEVGDPTEAVEVLADRYGFSDDEQKGVLSHLARGGDLTLWGLANAVTRVAEDITSYDRAVEFERIGGEVVELPKSVFNN